MYTSARALHEVLIKSLESGPKVIFADALAEALDLTGDDPQGAAILQIRRLAKQVQVDIEGLEFDPDRKKFLLLGLAHM